MSSQVKSRLAARFHLLALIEASGRVNFYQFGCPRSGASLLLCLAWIGTNLSGRNEIARSKTWRRLPFRSHSPAFRAAIHASTRSSSKSSGNAPESSTWS